MQRLIKNAAVVGAVLACSGLALAQPRGPGNGPRDGQGPLGGPMVEDEGPGGPGGPGFGERGPRRPGEGLLRRADTDGDRFISDAEIDAVVEQMLARAQESGRVPPRADTDGDGVLSADELVIMETHLRERLTRGAEHFNAMHAKLLENFDADGDGVLNETERLAAREARQERIGERREKMHAKALELFDEDGNGQLDPEERELAREAMAERRDRFRQELRDGSGDGRGPGGPGGPGAQRGPREAIRAIDEDRNHNIDAAELAAGLKLIEAGDERFDLNRDGAVDNEDIQVLIEVTERINSREPGQGPGRRQPNQR